MPDCARCNFNLDTHELNVENFEECQQCLEDTKRTVTPEQALRIVLDRADSIEYSKVYYALKSMGLRNLFKPTVIRVRQLVAMHLEGLPITAYSLSFVAAKHPMSCLTQLHGYGDKKILTMIRSPTSKYLRWVLSPLFKEKMGIEDEREEVPQEY